MSDESDSKTNSNTANPRFGGGEVREVGQKVTTMFYFFAFFLLLFFVIAFVVGAFTV